MPIINALELRDIHRAVNAERRDIIAFCEKIIDRYDSEVYTSAARDILAAIRARL